MMCMAALMNMMNIKNRHYLMKTFFSDTFALFKQWLETGKLP